MEKPTTCAEELLAIYESCKELTEAEFEQRTGGSQLDRDTVLLAYVLRKQPQELIDQAIRENWNMDSLVSVLLDGESL